MRSCLPPSCSNWKSPPGGRSRTVARAQDDGERDPQGGARAGAGKKTDLAVKLYGLGRFPMKQVTDTLGLARSNIAERAKRARPKREPQTRDGDLELTAATRR